MSHILCPVKCIKLHNTLPKTHCKIFFLEILPSLKEYLNSNIITNFKNKHFMYP